MIQTTKHVAVVGAGVVGLSIASELLSRGFKVSCISPVGGNIGSASRASGAMRGAFGEVTLFKSHDKVEEETRMRVESAKIYKDWLLCISGMSGLPVPSGDGTFILSNNASEEDDANIEEILRVCSLYDEPALDVEPNDCEFLKPHGSFKPSRLIFLPNEGHVDSRALLRSLWRRCELDPGFRFYDESAEEIKENGKKIITRSGHSILCDYSILASGSSVSRLVPEIEKSIKYFPRVVKGKGSYIILNSEKRLPYVIRTPNRDFACGIHMVPRESNSIYLGATNRIEFDDDYNSKPSVGELLNLMYNGSHQLNTDIRLWSVEEFGSGGRPSSLDGKLIVGPIENTNIIVASGTYRNGILLAPRISQIVANAIDGDETEYVCFSPSRTLVDSPPDRIEQVVRRAFADLVQHLLEPNGFLPYDRQHKLASYLAHTFMGAMGKIEQVQAIEEFLVDFRKEYHAELIPALFEKLSVDDS